MTATKKRKEKTTSNAHKEVPSNGIDDPLPQNALLQVNDAALDVVADNVNDNDSLPSYFLWRSLLVLRFSIFADAVNSQILGPNYGLLVLDDGHEVSPCYLNGFRNLLAVRF